MSDMILKVGIVPNSNNQSVRYYCDDNQCLNLEGCLYNRHSNGKLRPNVIGKFTDYSTISRTVCTDYLPPSDTPILRTRESVGFEGDNSRDEKFIITKPSQADYAIELNKLKNKNAVDFASEATIKAGATEEEFEDISRIISIYIGDEPKKQPINYQEIIDNHNKCLNIRRAKALGECIDASLKDLEKLAEKLGISVKKIIPNAEIEENK